MEIGDLEYEKSFEASSEYKTHRKLPGALIATDWNIKYKMKERVARMQFEQGEKKNKKQQQYTYQTIFGWIYVFGEILAWLNINIIMP